MSTRRVLLVCYYFPPLGGAGVGRPAALMRHLGRHGIECHVLTVKNVAYRVFEPEMLDGLDLSRIHRSGSWDPQRFLYLFGRRRVSDQLADRSGPLASRFFPDSKIGWTAPAIRKGMRLIRKRRFDVILSTSPPISAHLVGHKLAAESGLPWIADFRDFWTSERIEDVFSDDASVQKARTLLQAIKSRAARLTVCNPAIAGYLGGGEVIYNSFDSELARLWQPPPPGETFTIGLLGTYDQLVPVAPLLDAVSLLGKTVPECYARLKLVSVGRLDQAWLRDQLPDPDLASRWQLHGFRGRRDTIRLLSGVHLFYVGLKAGSADGIVPGRLFDMLVSGRPILAADSSEGGISRLLDRTEAGLHFEPDHPESVASAVAYIAGLAGRQERGDLSITPCPAYSEDFSDTRMAERFARLIQQA